MPGENHAAAGLLQETGLCQPAQVGPIGVKGGLVLSGGKEKHAMRVLSFLVFRCWRRRFGTERLYAQKEDLLHEVLELEAEKGLLASGDKYQVGFTGFTLKGNGSILG